MTPLQLTVREILFHATSYQWSTQGFGLLRLYLGVEARLHVWDPALRYGPDVSMIHTHSWDLKSTIIAGRLVNQRYEEVPEVDAVRSYNKQVIVCGYNSRPMSGPSIVGLRSKRQEVYHPGDLYSQWANEIHETVADPFTTTLMERREEGEGAAAVYWPLSSEFGTAKPRPATIAEVMHAAQGALELFK